MFYFYIILIIVSLHYIVKILTFRTVSQYLFEANFLLRAKNYTDGCSTPFKNYIHRWLSHSHDLCAAHDYGSLGLITVARPGWHNNLITWFAHMSQRNPVYWVWGTIVALVTLPWVVWRRNLGVELISMGSFYSILTLGSAFATLYYYG